MQIIPSIITNAFDFFKANIPKYLDEYDITDFQLLDSSEVEDKSLIRFYVHKSESADEDGADQGSRTIVPFQVAYAVSIHKAQGLEFD